MKIKATLLMSTGLLVFSMTLMLVLQMYSVNTMTHLLEGVETADAIDKGVLQLRRNEKDFLARKDAKYIGKFKKNVDGIVGQSKILKTTFRRYNLETDQIEKFDMILDEYQRTFVKLNEQQRKIGYKADQGLQGKLDLTEKSLVDSLSASNHQALSQYFNLRSIEKTFLLSPEQQSLALMQSAIDNASELRVANRNLLNEYQDAFNALFNAKKAFGFNKKLGILGKLRKTVHQTEEVLKNIVETNKHEIKATEENVTVIQFTLFIVLLVIALSISLMTSRTILNPIERWRDLMIEIGETKTFH